MKISVFHKTKQAGSYTLALVVLSADKTLVKTFTSLYSREKNVKEIPHPNKGKSRVAKL